MNPRLILKNAMISLLMSYMAAINVYADDSRTTTSQPNGATQAALEKLAQTTEIKEFDQQLEVLIPGARENPSPFFAQLFMFAGRHDKEPLVRLTVATIIKRLNLSRDQLVAGAAPHLDSGDELVRKYAVQVLIDQEDWSASRPPDFSGYRAVVETDVLAGKEPQASLIRHMFKSDPGVALQTLVRAYQLRKPDEIKPILLGEHVVSELFWKRRNGFVEKNAVDPAVSSQLEQLSRHDRYWVRLYVATIIQQNPELAAPELAKKLVADSNQLVRDAAQSPKQGS